MGFMSSLQVASLKRRLVGYRQPRGAFHTLQAEVGPCGCPRTPPAGAPEINKEEFLALPVMKSTYYRFGLNLLSPKQGLNDRNGNLFQVAIRTPEHVDLFTQLKVGDFEHPRHLHTLCQRHHSEPHAFNCYVAPPLHGLYEIAVYAKTKNETAYREAICMRLRVSKFEMVRIILCPPRMSTRRVY